MTSHRGRGFAPAYRGLKPQAQQTRPAYRGTPGHQPALKSENTSVAPHLSQTPLHKLKNLNCTYGEVTPSRLPAGQKAAGTFTLSSGKPLPTPHAALPHGCESLGLETLISLQGSAPCRWNTQAPLTAPAPDH